MIGDLGLVLLGAGLIVVLALVVLRRPRDGRRGHGDSGVDTGPDGRDPGPNDHGSDGGDGGGGD